MQQRLGQVINGLARLAGNVATNAMTTAVGHRLVQAGQYVHDKAAHVANQAGEQLAQHGNAVAVGVGLATVTAAATYVAYSRRRTHEEAMGTERDESLTDLGGGEPAREGDQIGDATTKRQRVHTEGDAEETVVEVEAQEQPSTSGMEQVESTTNLSSEEPAQEGGQVGDATTKRQRVHTEDGVEETVVEVDAQQHAPPSPQQEAQRDGLEPAKQSTTQQEIQQDDQQQGAPTNIQQQQQAKQEAQHLAPTLQHQQQQQQQHQQQRGDDHSDAITVDDNDDGDDDDKKDAESPVPHDKSATAEPTDEDRAVEVLVGSLPFDG